jgi:hypothetical protein
MAERERLGDLQLYRIPLPVTVAANAQKQVGLIDQPAVRVATVYRFAFVAGSSEEMEARPLLRTQNRVAYGLGLPLPAGNVVLFKDVGGRPILVGEAPLGDRTVGEMVELGLSASPGVRGRLQRADASDRFLLTVTNDRSTPVKAEVALVLDDGQRISADARLVRRDGQTLWAPTIPANGRATLRYRLRK